MGREDRVAALCTNSHVMLELHHAVPMLGAALVTLNTRLSADEMAALLAHSGASVLVATHEFADRARHLARRACLPYFIAGGPADSYEDGIAGADEAVPAPVDERQLLAINYTSGTTGRPKGVMYHHRGAYLQAAAMAYHAEARPGCPVPVDAADVPLQRLVLPLGGHRGRRRPRVPAGGGHCRDLAAAAG